MDGVRYANSPAELIELIGRMVDERPLSVAPRLEMSGGV
jgi:hypothetical protein